MNEFVIHGFAGSPFGRSVLIALQEKGAPYRFIPMAPGAQRTAEHLARHPFGRVPTLQHGDFRLFETQAILRYIDRVLAQPALTPTDIKAASLMDQFMNINDWYLFQGVSNVIVFQRVISPRLLGQLPDESAIAAAMPKAHVVYDALAKLLGDRAFLVGDFITLADILLAPQVDMFRDIPEWEPLTAKHANLCAWIERISARPSMQATTWERLHATSKAA